ncbi:MAG: hypothetical protein J4G05_03275 [Chlorobi bacterium]|nr:hypothetical protein [Chlorobiota bacterium]
MELSTDTINVLNFLDEFSPNGLRKRSDLGLLFELTASRDAHEEMNDLLFHGTHLFNTYHTLRHATSNAEGYKNLEKEFTNATEHLRDLMAKALVDAEEIHVERFETTYYAMTQGSLRNLIDLAYDLRVAKQVQNDNKFKRQNPK